jgi:hypothetical protein
MELRVHVFRGFFAAIFGGYLRVRWSEYAENWEKQGKKWQKSQKNAGIRHFMTIFGLHFSPNRL